MTVVSPVLGANCYIVGPAPGGPAVIIDPGFGVLSQLQQVVAGFDIDVMAVLVTHGHPDHVFSLREVCDSFDVDAYIGVGDRYRLADPMAGLDPQLREIVTHLTVGDLWVPPDGVVEIAVQPGEATDLGIPGVDITALAAPGHTEGSTVYLFSGVPSSSELLVRNESVSLEGMYTAFTGDVLFAGSVGRTDLPGGDLGTMNSTLEHLVSELDPETIILPGHGPYSRMDQEVRCNPYLR